MTIEDIYKKSSNIAKDKILMWETVLLKKDVITSSHEAVWAASRIFNTVKLSGLNKKELFDLLGNPKKSNESVYNFPFYTPSGDAVVYRFDTGHYGWQFNVYFDDKGKVFTVERRWIEE